MDVCGTSSVFVLRAVCLVSVLGVPVSLESLGTVVFHVFGIGIHELGSELQRFEIGLLEIVFPKSLGYAKSSATKVRLITQEVLKVKLQRNSWA